MVETFISSHFNSHRKLIFLLQIPLSSLLALLGGASGAEGSGSLWDAGLRDGELRRLLERPGEALGLEVVTQQRAGERGVASSAVGGADPSLLKIHEEIKCEIKMIFVSEISWRLPVKTPQSKQIQ